MSCENFGSISSRFVRTRSSWYTITDPPYSIYRTISSSHAGKLQLPWRRYLGLTWLWSRTKERLRKKLIVPCVCCRYKTWTFLAFGTGLYIAVFVINEGYFSPIWSIKCAGIKTVLRPYQLPLHSSFLLCPAPKMVVWVIPIALLCHVKITCRELHCGSFVVSPRHAVVTLK